MLRLFKWYLPLFLFVGCLASGLMIYQLRSYYSAEVDKRLRQRTEAYGELVRSELKSLQGQTQLIANNSMVVNSTIDSEQGPEDLEPFFNTLDFQQLNNELLSLHDYKGNPIASNTTDDVGPLSKRMMDSVQQESGYLKLDKDTYRMVLPVFVHGTIEGYLNVSGGKETVDSLFETIFIKVPTDSFVGIQNTSGEYVWRTQQLDSIDKSPFATPRSVSIPPTSLSLQYSEPSSSLYNFMNSLTLQITALLLVGFLITIISLVWLSLKIIGPITRLSQKLRENNSRLNLAKQAGQTGIWDYNVHSETLSWDNEMVEIFGFEAEDYDDFITCVHPKDREEVNSAVEHSLDTGEPFHNEYRINNPRNDELRWIDAHALIKNDDRRTKKMIGSCQDITQQKQDEQFLLQLNEIASDITTSHDEKIRDVLQLGSVYFDLPLGFVTHIDQQTQEIEYVYGTHPEIKPGASEDLSKAYCKKTIKEDAPVFLESADQVKDVLGPEPYETFGLSCYLGGKLRINGELYGTVCFADQTDRPDKPYTKNEQAKLDAIIQWITSQMERKQAMEKISRARQEAEEANEAKSRFLARMSHEIRTPLNAIMGMADLLSETELDEEQDHYVSVFQNSSKILLNLINDVLDLSKIEAGELELHESYFDIEKLVIDTAEFFAEKAHGKGLELNAFVDPECPPAVRTDINRFRQILVNLIGNAIKFTEEGEVTVNLHVEERDENNVDLRLEVRDTGEGISEEDQAHIFQEFTQTDESSTREQSGTGLGLSICENLVSKMNGDIGVHSKLGDGSTFYVEVSLPCKYEPAEGSDLSEVNIDRLADHSVLVVDDNATNREILHKYLRSADVNVDTCMNGEEALDQLESNPDYDLIFMDNQMPGPNGYEIIEQLPGDYRPNDVVMLTSDGMKRSRNKAEEFDLGGFYIKPISRGELLNVLSKQIFGASETESAETKESTDETEESADDHLTGRLLLVEDDDNNRILVSSYLKNTGIEIDDAVNGEQALDMLKENEYDLVLMDLDMPVMDGYEATSRYRGWEDEEQDRDHTSIVALSAHAMDASQTKAEESGCDDYLSKPIQKEKLLETVRSYFEDQEA
jgi:PAS domain S-box-containing protein